MARHTAKNEFFEGIRLGTTEMIRSLRGEKKLTVRRVKLPEPARPMTATQITALRTRRLRVSQAVFARLLNVSPQAVRNWEQGINQPSGATLRLLQLTARQPEILLAALAG